MSEEEAMPPVAERATLVPADIRGMARSAAEEARRQLEGWGIEVGPELFGRIVARIEDALVRQWAAQEVRKMARKQLAGPLASIRKTMDDLMRSSQR